MEGGSTVMPPLAVGRVLIPVKYLASVSVHTAQSVAHFFLVAENSSRIPKGKSPNKRVAIIADRATFQADLDAALNRCVMFSQIEELSLLDEHLGPLTGPFSEIDYVVQQCPAQDFQRVVSAIFKPMSAVNTVPTYVLEQGNAVSSRAHCRLALNALQDVVGTAAQEASVKQLRVAKDRELQALQDALTKQKDESLMEMVELHTQKETLKHALQQCESVLSSTRRQQKEERDLLLAKVRQLEAERDVKMGKAPGSGPRFDENALSIPAPNVNGSMATGGVRAPNSPLEAAMGRTGVQGTGIPPNFDIPTTNTYGGNTSSSSHIHQSPPGARPLGREQMSSTMFNNNTSSINPAGSYSVQSPEQGNSNINFGSPSYGGGGATPPQPAAPHGGGWAAHSFNGASSPAPTSGYPQQQHQQAPSPAGYGGGGSAPSAGGTSIALDQLQNQLSDGEKFLVSLQKRKAEAAGRTGY